MIRIIESYDECKDFAADFAADPTFSDPMLTTDEQVRCNLIKSINQPERHRVIGVYDGDRMTGLFAFLVLPDENYLEMLVGLSREQSAYRESLRYLEENYPNFTADFVFNPNNFLLKNELAARNALFEKEQQKMVFTGQMPSVDTAGIEPLTEKFAAEYCEIHNKEMYWTAEKVLRAQERFRTLLAIDGGKVVGYIDVTKIFDENEPFDLFVLENHRRKGHGRRLLAKALELNRPHGMMLLVETDNAAAIRLYESTGFATVHGQNNLTAHLTLPPTE